MLHYLRKKRFTLGRGVLAIFASTWLLLAFQSCVVAATPDMAGCGAMAASPMAASMGGHADHQERAPDTGCCPPVVCQALATADYKAVDHGGAVQWDLYVLQPKPLENIAAELAPATGRLQAYQADYLPPHPTVRFCVLRI